MAKSISRRQKLPSYGLEMKNLGTSLMVFGGLVFGGGIILIPILDVLTIDLIALHLLYAGKRIRDGENQPTKWPTIWSAWYCIIAIVLIATALVAPESLKVGKYNLEPGWPVAITVAGLSVFLAWSFHNLRKLLQVSRDGTTGQVDATDV